MVRTRQPFCLKARATRRSRRLLICIFLFQKATFVWGSFARAQLRWPCQKPSGTSASHGVNGTHATLLGCQIERKIAYVTQPASIYEFLQLFSVHLAPYLRDSLDKFGKGNMVCAIHAISAHGDGGKMIRQGFEGDDQYV
jgi:hypothetical protein